MDRPRPALTVLLWLQRRAAVEREGRRLVRGLVHSAGLRGADATRSLSSIRTPGHDLLTALKRRVRQRRRTRGPSGQAQGPGKR